MIQAVAFDFDGILVDSERIKMQCYVDALCKLANRSASLSSKDLVSKIGEDEKSIVRFIIAKTNLLNDQQISSFIEMKRQLFEQKINQGSILFFEETIALAKILHSSGVKVGIVTGSHSQTVRQIFQFSRENLNIFSVLLGREKVAKSKPNPELYEMFLSELGLRPSHCLAIEDSPAGISASCAAGILTYSPTRPYNNNSNNNLLVKFQDLKSLSDATMQRFIAS